MLVLPYITMITGVCFIIGALIVRRPIVQLKNELEKMNNMMSGKKV
jgi:hypothetical protein